MTKCHVLLWCLGFQLSTWYNLTTVTWEGSLNEGLSAFDGPVCISRGWIVLIKLTDPAVSSPLWATPFPRWHGGYIYNCLKSDKTQPKYKPANMHACIHFHSLLCSWDVMWPNVRSNHLDLPAMMDGHLELWTKINPFSPELLSVVFYYSNRTETETVILYISYRKTNKTLAKYHSS